MTKPQSQNPAPEPYWQKVMDEHRKLLEAAHKVKLVNGTGFQSHSLDYNLQVTGRNTPFGEERDWLIFRHCRNGNAKRMPFKFQVAVNPGHHWFASMAVLELVEMLGIGAMKFSFDSHANARDNNRIVIYPHEGDFAAANPGDFVDMLESMLHGLPNVPEGSAGIAKSVGYGITGGRAGKVYFRMDDAPGQLSPGQMQVLHASDPAHAHLLPGYISRKAVKGYAKTFNVPEHNPFGHPEHGLDRHRIDVENGRWCICEHLAKQSLGWPEEDLKAHGYVTLPQGARSMGRNVGGERGVIFRQPGGESYFVRIMGQDYPYSAPLQEMEDGSFRVGLAYGTGDPVVTLPRETLHAHDNRQGLASR